ncbi:MAG TPA: DUF72 domain-containing protein [Candidatus Ratteibacteria bacterium]|nr:DUF72 domain-containing protein [bacterium]HRS06236.1 DUF72 domain-containing protein [Candidatus Ratteibacteria bacterium]HRV03962.1 DUF72 domain-containing protein [Candidatus Ratteibacteria bacterium]
MTTVKIGTSGFSFPDWKGVVYPEGISTGKMLEYYSEYLGFNAVEINSTYYHIPAPENLEAMAKKTRPDFIFSVKAYKGITHDFFDDRLETKPDVKQVEESSIKFKEAIIPLKKMNKLGAVLLQFPVFFYPSSDSYDFIIRLKEILVDLPLVIEFRNIAWASTKHYDFLKKNNIAFCAVDEPKLHRLMPLNNVITSNIAYLRCHGRNKNWFNTPVSERYNYNYSDQELEEIERVARSMMEKSEISFIFFNNCHAGYAAKNAMKFAEMLDIQMKNDSALF